MHYRSDHLRRLTPQDVTDADKLAEYTRQQLGCPSVSVMEKNKLKTMTRKFFEEHPHVDWMTLVRTVQYCKAKRRRIPYVWSIVDQVRWAWSDGFLPELDAKINAPTRLDEQIARVLLNEERPGWRYRLLTTVGDENRQALLDAWHEDAAERGSQT